MASQLVGPAESFRATGELASMRLLSSVGTNVASLVLETMEGLIAERTFVRTRQIRTMFVLVLHCAHGRHGHGGARHRCGRC